MPNWRAIHLLALASTLAWACAVPAADKAPRRATKVLDGVETVALVPARIPFSLLDRMPEVSDLVTQLETQATERLRRAGITVIESRRLQELIEEEATRAPPLYDRFTRERNDAAFSTVHSTALKRFIEQHRPDALLDIAVYEDFAEVREGLARWRLVVESAAGRSATEDFLKGRLKNNVFAPALSMKMTVQRLPLGIPPVHEIAGLQLLIAQTAGSRGGPPKKIPLLQDPARQSRALDLTLGRWLMTAKDYQAARLRAQRKPKPPPLSEATVASPFDGAAFRTEHRRLAVAPVDITVLEGLHARMAPRYEQLLSDELIKVGFEVVSTPQIEAAWYRARASSPGFFHPTTGIFRPAEREAVMRRTLDDLAARMGVDAVVAGKVILTHAHYTHGVAEWDGSDQSVAGATGRLAGLTTDAGDYFGVVTATSFELEIWSARNGLVTKERAGIEVTRKVEGGVGLDVPPIRWFEDEARDEQAVRLVIAPLADQAGAAPGR